VAGCDSDDAKKAYIVVRSDAYRINRYMTM